MLATVMHLLRGTPYIYQGEEIGMINPNYQTITDYVDVETLNAYDELKQEGLSDAQALAIIQAKSRDNSRTPCTGITLLMPVLPQELLGLGLKIKIKLMLQLN